MQATFSFHCEEELILPIQYNQILQGFIYNSIDQDLANILHDRGYMINKRSFKLFVFSRILGNFKLNNKDQTINFGQDFKLKVASPLENFCQSICKCMIQKEDLRLTDKKIYLSGVDLFMPSVYEDEIYVQTLSPVCVYSTLFKPDGSKYTCYFQPGEEEFNRLITKNLIHKFQLIYSHKILPEESIELKANRLQLNIVNYKNFIIKGYSGYFNIKGPAELLQLALNAGLGSKNSQGLGYIEIFKK